MGVTPWTTGQKSDEGKPETRNHLGVVHFLIGARKPSENHLGRLTQDLWREPQILSQLGLRQTGLTDGQTRLGI